MMPRFKEERDSETEINQERYPNQAVNNLFNSWQS